MIPTQVVETSVSINKHPSQVHTNPQPQTHLQLMDIMNRKTKIQISDENMYILIDVFFPVVSKII